jgi:hypothetical protein
MVAGVIKIDEVVTVGTKPLASTAPKSLPLDELRTEEEMAAIAMTAFPLILTICVRVIEIPRIMVEMIFKIERKGGLIVEAPGKSLVVVIAMAAAPPAVMKLAKMVRLVWALRQFLLIA